MIRKRAFTLIELLVVIAIIAILAAILFPVFAQAKIAAKGAASISNSKQIVLAAQMYSADYNDYAVPDEDWLNVNKDMLGYSWGVPPDCWAPWGWLILPYVKTAALYEDPLTKPANNVWGLSVTYSEYPEYGYNYATWSPWFGATTLKWGQNVWDRAEVSLTSVARPANTVMFTSKFNWDDSETDWWWWWGPGTMWVGKYNVDGPDCNDIPSICMNNWGTGTWLADYILEDKPTNGAFTGGVTFRKAGQAVVAWGDGHVTTQPAGSLAAGTNWNPNIAASALVMLDWSKYQWWIN